MRSRGNSIYSNFQNFLSGGSSLNKFHKSIELKPAKYTSDYKDHYLDTSISFYIVLGKHFDKAKIKKPIPIEENLKYLKLE